MTALTFYCLFFSCVFQSTGSSREKRIMFFGPSKWTATQNVQTPWECGASSWDRMQKLGNMTFPGSKDNWEKLNFSFSSRPPGLTSLKQEMTLGACSIYFSEKKKENLSAREKTISYFLLTGLFHWNRCYRRPESFIVLTILGLSGHQLVETFCYSQLYFDLGNVMFSNFRVLHDRLRHILAKIGFSAMNSLFTGAETHCSFFLGTSHTCALVSSGAST